MELKLTLTVCLALVCCVAIVDSCRPPSARGFRHRGLCSGSRGCLWRDDDDSRFHIKRPTLTEEEPVNGHVESLVQEAMAKIRVQYPGEFEKMEPISYRKILFSGYVYFVKVKVIESDGRTSYAHLRLYEPFSKRISVSGIKMDVDESTPLEYFDANSEPQPKVSLKSARFYRDELATGLEPSISPYDFEEGRQ